MQLGAQAGELADGLDIQILQIQLFNGQGGQTLAGAGRGAAIGAELNGIGV